MKEEPALLHSESEAQVLAAIRELMGISMPFEEVVAGALRLAAATMGADASTLLFIERPGQYEKFLFAPAQGVRKLEGIALSPGEGVVGCVVETGSPLVVPDVAHEPRFSERVDQLPGHKARSIACAPLRARDELIGVLTVAKGKAGAWSEKDLEPLTTLAFPVAIMIENARVLREVKNLHEKLEQANRVKAQFLATTSHELRTPIHIIIGNLDILLGGFLGELTPGEALNLISSLLDLSRIEAGQFVIHVEEFRLEDVWKELELLFRIGLSGKEVELIWEAKGPLPLFKTDKIKVKEILSNIIFNAVKYTYKGRIEVAASALGAGEAVQIEVRDTGVGIPKEFLPLIFEPFRQVESSSPGAHGGVGLGLTIAQRLLDLLHGQVEVESAVDKGSTFRVTIPTKYSA